ncbi:GNAT family N-acetyltransferase [Flavobacterium sp. W21_SRS_FM6]|uniref:GNAT family N-acetyltransferase n=1 Tax=Flavobacterium sp. W21_SRS_FM6 TaxID=3240268 RepID=UPI003F900763
MTIEYKVNQPISVEEFCELLSNTSLGARRPLHNKDLIQGMLDNANLVVTAWQQGKLLGLARSVTDFHYCCYLSDLAVHEGIQSQGIGRNLIKLTKEQLNDLCSVILLAAPLAEGYYPKIGFEQHDSAWILRSISQLS